MLQLRRGSAKRRIAGSAARIDTGVAGSTAGAAGASSANHWIYETPSGPDALDWTDPTDTDVATHEPTWRDTLDLCWTDLACPRAFVISHGGDWTVDDYPYDSENAFHRAQEKGADGIVNLWSVKIPEANTTINVTDGTSRALYGTQGAITCELPRTIATTAPNAAGLYAQLSATGLRAIGPQ